MKFTVSGQNPDKPVCMSIYQVGDEVRVAANGVEVLAFSVGGDLVLFSDKRLTDMGFRTEDNKIVVWNP